MQFPEWFLLIFSILCGFYLFFMMGKRYQKEMMARQFGKNHYQQKNQAFAALNPYLNHDLIIFCGDSITEGFSLSELFQRDDLINRGISGDTVQGLKKRLKVSCSEIKPRKVFILIGTNDLASKNALLSSLEKDYLELKKELDKASYPYWMISLLPTNERLNLSVVKGRSCEKIIRVNQFLSNTFKEHFINIYDAFTDSKGQLNEIYTHDGLHLNINGYLHFKNQLLDYIK